MQSNILVSNIFLAGVSSYCLNRVMEPDVIICLPVISYSLILIKACTGILREVIPIGDCNCKAINEIASIAHKQFTFPCIVGQLWLNSGMSITQIGYVHPMLALIPYIMYMNYNKDEDIEEAVQILTTLSCLYITTIKRNWFGFACGIFFTVFHLGKFDDEIFHLPVEEVYNGCLGVCCILVLYALGEIVELPCISNLCDQCANPNLKPKKK